MPSFANKVRLVLIVLLQFMLTEVYGKKRRGKNKTRRSRYSKDSVDYSTPLYMMLFLLILIFAPVICMFLHSVYKDPLTPKVMQGMWDFIKGRWTGYLSGDKGAREE